MDVSSRSAGKLGLAANVSRSSTSGRLSKRVDSGILTGSKLGRQKYYRITAAAVVHAVGTCYDHLAGRLGVEITASLERQRIIRPTGNTFEVTGYG